jgi:hypothetical protein
MARHYFHIANGTEVFRDTDGRDCVDLAAAHRYAMQLIYKSMVYDPDQRDWHGWRVDVTDAEGYPVMSVLYPSNLQLPRATFGQRTRINLSIICGAVLGLGLSSAAAVSQPIADALVCVRTEATLNCSHLDGRGNAGIILHVEPSADAEQRARAANREREWMIKCRPAIRYDALGVGRYHYAARGCEFGRSWD